MRASIKIRGRRPFSLWVWMGVLILPFSEPKAACQIEATKIFTVGVESTIQLQCDDTTGLSISWEFGDGASLPYTPGLLSITHTYTTPEVVTVFARIQGQLIPVSSFNYVLHTPTSNPPTHTQSIIHNSTSDIIWSVNPDNHTVVAVSANTLIRSNEIKVGKNPRTLALDKNGDLWVVNQGSASISILRSASVVQTLSLPRASRPYGIVMNSDGSTAYVTLQATGQLLRFDVNSKVVTGSLDLCPTPRAIAVTGDGARIFVTRWISPDTKGEVYEVGASSFTLSRVFSLALDTAQDSESNGRGLPNVLNDIVISPDGRYAWVTAKKDNIQRGGLLDGLGLNFENTVRTIVMKLDLINNEEVLNRRRDINDRGMAYALAFQPDGKFVYVSSQTTNEISILRSHNGDNITAIEPLDSLNEQAPEGMVLVRDSLLFVQYFTSRKIGVYDVSKVDIDNILSRLALIPSVELDSLPYNVLRGKQIFYNSRDPRMTKDGYITCQTCHLEGGHDGRTYDRSTRGEGLRNTTSLMGKAGLEHGPLFWTANADEIQDSEGGIRAVNEGSGFMDDALFNSGTVNQKLGDPKAGLSLELDQLAAYISSLTHAPPSPYRQSNGSMTLEALAGKDVFERVDVGCNQCHTGQRTTISNFTGNPLFDVGTFTALSGQRVGEPLTGLDVPTLNGVWQTAPYLHDGSAETLMEVLTTKNSEDKHGVTSHLSTTELNQLVAYMLQLDDKEKIVVSVKPERQVNNSLQVSFPSLGFVRFTFVGKEKPLVSVFNVKGQPLTNSINNNWKVLNNGSWELLWPLPSQLNRGVYFLQWKTKNGLHSKKWIL